MENLNKSPLKKDLDFKATTHHTYPQKIFIAIPNGGKIVPALVRCLIQWTHDPRFAIKLFMPSGIFPLDNARNYCVKEFLETDCDLLWWIDDDITPPIQTLERLVFADKDAIGAACFSMKSANGEYFPYPVTLRFNKDKRYEAYYGTGIEEVDAVGGACVMVKRKVYESMVRPYEFVYHKDGTLALTCDFRVWQKAKEKGFKLFVDFGLLCDHQKVCSIKGIQDLMGSINEKDSQGGKKL